MSCDWSGLIFLLGRLLLGIFSVGQVLMLFAFNISLNLCVIACCVPVGPLAQGDDNLVMRPKRTDWVIKMIPGIAGAHTWGGQTRYNFLYLKLRENGTVA